MFDPASTVTALLTILVVFYAGSVVFWLFETSVLAPLGTADGESNVWGLDDVQVRISTIGNESVVQTTVDALPEGLIDVHVIAEEAIEVSGATVHVVPESFSCLAGHKGRALEWARRNVPCDREYVLFLDEDTLVSDLNGLPDADVVQFTELPMYTGSRWTYLCEVFRIGYQYEQRAFATFRFPLYVWGGGIAIRRSVEERVTWDRRTITEDTAFVWTAAAELGVDMVVSDRRFRNQAPPSIRGLIRQRRRWMSGTREDGHMLPLPYRVFVATRATIWALSPFLVIIGAVSVFIPGIDLVVGAFADVLVLVLLLFLHFVTAVGASVYGLGARSSALAVLLTIPIVVLNTVGALWGFVSPTRSFSVTPKVTAETIAEEHPGVDHESPPEAEAVIEADEDVDRESPLTVGRRR